MRYETYRLAFGDVARPRWKVVEATGVPMAVTKAREDLDLLDLPLLTVDVLGVRGAGNDRRVAYDEPLATWLPVDLRRFGPAPRRDGDHG